MFVATENRTHYPIDLLRHVLAMDENTGILTWQNLGGPRSDRNGKRAGSARSDGYLQLQFDSKKLLVHRICWALKYGKWPDVFLDHKNGVRSDNRISNLREATFLENQQNLTKQTGTKLSSMGVAPSGEKFWAYITHNKKRLYLGTFDTEAEASFARERTAKKLHTHRREV